MCAHGALQCAPPLRLTVMPASYWQVRTVDRITSCTRLAATIDANFPTCGTMSPYMPPFDNHEFSKALEASGPLSDDERVQPREQQITVALRLVP